MYNVGDKVRLKTHIFGGIKDEGVYYSKLFGSRHEITVTYLHDGSTQELSFSDDQIELISQPSFQVGDKVYYTGRDARYRGIELEIQLISVNNNYVVANSTNITNSIYLDLKDIRKAPPTPSTQNQTKQHTFTTGASGTVGSGGIIGAAKTAIQTAQQFYTGGSWTLNEPGKIEYNSTKESGCQHEWRDYIGLSKRMDICTKCPASKNERGIYE